MTKCTLWVIINVIGVANGSSKIFSSDLENLTAFSKSLEVLFIVHLFQS